MLGGHEHEARNGCALGTPEMAALARPGAAAVPEGRVLPCASDATTRGGGIP